MTIKYHCVFYDYTGKKLYRDERTFYNFYIAYAMILKIKDELISNGILSMDDYANGTDKIEIWNSHNDQFQTCPYSEIGYNWTYNRNKFDFNKYNQLIQKRFESLSRHMEIINLITEYPVTQRAWNMEYSVLASVIEYNDKERVQ